MSADLLDRATRALRDTTGSDPAALERVLDRLERQRPPSRASMRHVRVVAWTLAGSLLGVGAWANATGRVHWFVPEAPSAPPAAAPVDAPPVAAVARSGSRRRAVSPPVEVPEVAEVPPEPAPPEPEEALDPEVSPAPPVAPAPPASETPRAPADRKSSAAAPRPPDADVLYRSAHEAHFVRADYAQALALWDRYLEAAEPGHRWKIEARYNRGIALYRLGRSELAREALEPFARGEYGGYRRNDARRLLEALPPEALPPDEPREAKPRSD